ncbi:MAG: nucleotidyl transferase AbiEii/AbiGii toxin family protein [Candidatus Omnitrophica bacterium]|nr:nucleotidyl transferase AbiEii/AbiGii toxin family protein [Candidatus Omnitrophota bacterium]
MKDTMYNQLQLRELFHLEFLRWFARKIKAQSYTLKGGSNLRFFYNSFRYSEDMDLDIQGVEVDALKDVVMKILQNVSFQGMFKPFGCERVTAPDIAKAKQTQTTQRFKAHLITSAGEDLFTKIEFSRRGFKGKAVVQGVSDIILRSYKLAPLLVPHYDAQSTTMQKIDALVGRPAIQARDVFDLYILSSQCGPSEIASAPTASGPRNDRLDRARENLFEVSFEQFRDTVVSYLSLDDQPMYNSSSSWDEIKLKAANFIEQLRSRK